MLYQETDNTETSKQIDFSVASLSKKVIKVTFLRAKSFLSLKSS